eukprot:TRINITY_DN5255_c0_g1_i1.p1 TRINITY_DN5255_c0_g1~~TRINITY_DN5255_c0_g1_i1.p1  ORF type:complete len:294 (-),score=47.61 TRINITY_DN5255_c0_g1_i1:47-928(-)
MPLKAVLEGEDFPNGNSNPTFDLSTPLDISIKIKPHTEEKVIRAFYIPNATSTPVRGEGFVGDVRQGGSVNCEIVTFAPHANGTHTECVGHFTKSRIPITKILSSTKLLFPAFLVSVQPEPISDSGDTYPAKHDPNDLVVSLRKLKEAIERVGHHNLLSGHHVKGVVIRTLPNHESKATSDYSGTNPTFITPAVCAWLKENGVEHLIVDLPSVDRECDEGKLASHKTFLRATNADVSETDDTDAPFLNSTRTITELCFAPNEVKDGLYLLDLQIAAFELDAAPCRPVLYPLIE